MFKVLDCFLASGVFNDALIKRFKENYDAENGSRLWMIPGHVIYTTPDKKIYTCDARPLDLLSPSEIATGELISYSAIVLDIFFQTEKDILRMYIALNNGDVQIFEYRAVLYEWARVGYFNVNITSPNNSNDQKYVLDKVFISLQQNKIYWSEKIGNESMNSTLFARTLPLNSVREITQTAIGASQVLFKACPNFDIFEISENICIIPQLPNNVNLYLILSARSHLWVFDITGKCLWRGVILEQSMDFISLCMKIVGLWTQKGSVRICYSLYHNRKMGYIFHDNTLIKVTSNGDICSKTDFDLTFTEKQEFYVLWNILCVVGKQSLLLYNLENGKKIQEIMLENYLPMRGIWCHVSRIPCLGFYNSTSIFMLQPQSIASILSSKETSFSQVLNVLSGGDMHLYVLMKDLVFQRIKQEDLVPLQHLPDVLQSKALLLALFNLCQTKGIDVEKFPFSPSCINALFCPNSEIPYPETKLKAVLEPLVDCYCKIEEAKKKLLTNT